MTAYRGSGEGRDANWKVSIVGMVVRDEGKKKDEIFRYENGRDIEFNVAEV